MAQKEVIEILTRYISLLKAEGISVDKAFLYGSYLTNTSTEDSDIDLLIVTENDTDDFQVGKIWSLTKKINPKIEPFLVGKARFYTNDNSPLIDLVKKTGLKIA